jgi:hypothetical protein
MRAVRWVVVFALLYYAGWMTAPFLEDVTGAAQLPRMEHIAAPGGLVSDAGNATLACLWLTSIVCYVLSAVFLAGYSRIAAGLYALGFVSNMAIYLIERSAMNDGSFLPVLVGLGVAGLLIFNSARLDGRRA